MTTLKRAADAGVRALEAARTEALFRSSGALREGHFQLKSGRHGDAYVEKFAVLADPAATSELCGFWAARSRGSDGGVVVDLVAGPTLERLKPIAAAHPDLTFIHVEPYELQFADGALQPVLNDGAFAPVDAVTAWGLRVEPYVFVIDAAGTVAASFELIFGDDELNAAIDALG